MSTEAPEEKSVPQDFVPPPAAPAAPDTGIDDLLPESKTIADGWFNADPVKVTPVCPSSRVSLFYGRVIPERQEPVVEIKEQTVGEPEGLAKFLIGKGGNAGGVQLSPQDPGGTTPEQASAAPTQDTTQQGIDEITVDFTPG